jgi:hypothetical protein
MTPYLAYAFLLLLVSVLIWRGLKRPQSLQQEFERWAQANDLAVIDAERRYIYTGPFIWKRSGIVFKIQAKSRTGQIQTGWIRFGYTFYSEQPWSTKVIWDRDS